MRPEEYAKTLAVKSAAGVASAYVRRRPGSTVAKIEGQVRRVRNCGELPDAIRAAIHESIFAAPNADSQRREEIERYLDKLR